MSILPKTEHLKRYKDVALLLMKYGRSDLVKGSGLESALVGSLYGLLHEERVERSGRTADELLQILRGRIEFTCANRFTDSQRHADAGLGDPALLEHLAHTATRRMLVGTWTAADWAIRFYRRHGFELVSPERRTTLLKAYWTISTRQIENSSVLANPPLAALITQPHIRRLIELMGLDRQPAVALA